MDSLQDCLHPAHSSSSCRKYRVFNLAYASALVTCPSPSLLSRAAALILTWPRSKPDNYVEYNSLQYGLNSEIRLLHLLPSSRNTKEAIINCELQEVTLRAHPPFVALSYTWGSPEATRCIRMNGHSKMIAENLLLALHHLQDKTHTLVLWVDSLCINQNSNDEKSQQVQLMDKIYQQAACVVAWLGSAADESDLAMRALDNIGYQCLSAGSKMGPVGSDERRRKNHEMHLKLLSMSTISNDSKATFPLCPILALFQRPYWQRVWVIQEIALSRSVIFVCGDSEIPLSHLHHAFNLFAALCSTCSFDHVKNVCMELQWKIATEINLQPLKLLRIGKPNPDRGELDFDGQPRSLASLVIGSSKSLMHSYATESFQSTDPRDRIFGLLGLSQDTEKSEIRSDYSKPTSTIFKEFATTMYRQGHFELLQHCNFQEGYSCMPSWVPDWSRPSDQITIPIRHAVTAEGEFKSASNYRTGNPVFLGDDDEVAVIKLSGICIDSIDVIGPAWDADSENLLTSASSWLAALENLAWSHKTIYESDDLSEAIWRTPIVDQEQTLGYYEYIHLKATEAIHTSYSVLRGFPDLPDNEVMTKEWKWLKCIPYLRTMNGMAHNRKPFVSSTGYLGLGPSTMKNGDVACILFGLHTPFILRETSKGRYRLIGDAFVYGVMCGEVIGDEDKNETFQIH